MNGTAKTIDKTAQASTVEAVIYSLLFHSLVLVVVSVGLPIFDKEPIHIAPPVTVELVDISEITQTNKVSVASKPQELDKKEPPKMEEEKPTPPKVDSDIVPDLSKPSAPDLEPNEDVAPPLPMPEKLAEVKDKPKPPPRKPEPPKKAQASKSKSFDSILKNLTPDSADKKEEAAEQTEDVNESEEKTQIAKLSEKLTISEEDALRQQLSKCWNIMAGAKYAENLVVEVTVIVNPDRTVKQALIMDKGRYNRDTHFRAAADAAVRALNNPRCSPLMLPTDKYDQWKKTVIVFDPRDML